MRKIWCEVCGSVIYENRCLFQMRKITEKNKTCSECIFHESLSLQEKDKKIKSRKIKKSKVEMTLEEALEKTVKELEEQMK